MKIHVQYFLIILATAISSNMFAGYFGLNYLWTVLVGMGIPALVAWIVGRKNLNSDDWKVFIAFNIFSVISSTIIEVIMLYYDTWGFSNSHGRFIGINFLGAPIEEYVYWWMAPVLVGILYIIFRKLKTIETFPPAIESSLEYLGYISSVYMKSSKIKDETLYLENDGVVVENGAYSRGTKKFPTWIWIQIFLVAILIYLKRYFKGNWLTVFSVSFIFACVAFIGELHAIDYGFWVYNKQRMIGIYFLNIPIEQYPMYFLSAIFECMVIDIIGRKYFNLR